mgnify:FL=1|tara:strand:+ start:90 stop:281 length:192 start_codon:yes stop_codon:yes gene_type:complete
MEKNKTHLHPLTDEHANTLLHHAVKGLGQEGNDEIHHDKRNSKNKDDEDGMCESGDVFFALRT